MYGVPSHAFQFGNSKLWLFVVGGAWCCCDSIAYLLLLYCTIMAGVEKKSVKDDKIIKNWVFMMMKKAFRT